MRTSLYKVLDRGHLENIRSIRPDDLAPSLGTIIRAIALNVTGEAQWLYYRPDVFLENTVLTDSFKNVIRDVVDTLRNGSVGGVFLNLDMGSGKTHLLALLLHLFVSCRLNPGLCEGYIDEYEYLGYSRKLAEKTVVIAVDMRAPENLFEYLKLTEIILRNMEVYRGAEIINESIRKMELPDPKKLAESIPEDLHILVLVDELHYAVTMGSEKERERVKQFISFILGLLNYRRDMPTRRGGIAFLVASARRDFERWHEIESDIMKEDSELVAKVNGFIQQLRRIEKVSTTHWLNLSEARKILEKRLKLKTSFNKVYHESFNKLILRVIRADSDIPQAHHMRSLIKAMAIYALNALDMGDDIVSPAHFSEDVIDTLLGDTEVAMSYKSIYSEIISRLANAKHKRWFKLAVNTIFTYTITGSPEKLVEMVRVAKTGETTTEHIPLIKEAELRDILVKVHELPESMAPDIIGGLDDVHPSIHRVRIKGGEEAYFIAPVASVLAIYRKKIKENYEQYMSNPDVVLKYISEYVESLSRSDEYTEQLIVRSLRELEKKPHSKDKFYIYIYYNDALVSQLSPKKETSQKSYGEMLKDVYRYYEGKHEHNVVIVVPRIKYNVLMGIARYLAIDDATEFIINNYIARLEKGSLFMRNKVDEIQRKLLEIELGDLQAEIGRKINEAISAFVDAMTSLLDIVVYYTPEGIKRESIKLNVIVNSKYGNKLDIHKAVDLLRGKKSGVLVDVAKALTDWIISSGSIRFVKSPSDAGNIIFYSIKDFLQTRLYKEIFLSDPIVEKLGNYYVYIPPKVIKNAIGTVKARIKEEFGKRYKVVIAEEDWKVTIKLEPLRESLLKESLHEIEVEEAEQGTVVETGIVGRAIVEEYREEGKEVGKESILDVVEELAEKGGVLWIAVEVSKDSVDVVKEALGMIEKYIKDYRGERD